MVKQSKKERSIFTNSSGETLLLYTSFLYEIDIFKYMPGRYNLEDSRTISATMPLSCSPSSFYKGTILYRKYTRLIAAPQEWLIENKFTELKQTDNV